MPSKPTAEVQPNDVVSLTMTGTLFQHLVKYLSARGLTVDPFPFATEDDDVLPSYCVGISDELMREANGY